jgi:predicted cation transporter
MSVTNALLLVILILIFVLPLVVKKVEENLEVFLFIMGVLATVTAGSTGELEGGYGALVNEIFSNVYMYIIVAIVLVGGFLFKALSKNMHSGVRKTLEKIPIEGFVFLFTVLLGLLSSVITAIVASLVLVEIVNVLPLNRSAKIKVNIMACFAIGLGAVLTPVGEPLATIVIGKLAKNPALHADFFYMIRTLGIYIIPGILVFGLIAVWFAKKGKKDGTDSEEEKLQPETYPDIVFRALKIFLFLIALDLLGSGFKPIIDAYVMQIPSTGLYWLNMCSAILDNATLASAEISPHMAQGQIIAILMGLLISGGMMIPGNIPNIISASKLKIKSKEWIKLGVPLGLLVMAIYFLILLPTLLAV